MAAVPSSDTEASPVLALAVLLAPGWGCQGDQGGQGGQGGQGDTLDQGGQGQGGEGADSASPRIALLALAELSRPSLIADASPVLATAVRAAVQVAQTDRTVFAWRSGNSKF